MILGISISWKILKYISSWVFAYSNLFQINWFYERTSKYYWLRLRDGETNKYGIENFKTKFYW